jgi:hypothetical protein
MSEVGSARRRGFVILSVIAITLAGCASPQHHNVTHPEYGSAEYDRDQAGCQRDNSHPVTRVTGYAEVKGTEPDEDKVRSCMALLGWQPAN